MSSHDYNSDDERPETPSRPQGIFQSRQALWVLGVLVVLGAGVFLVPKIIRPTVTVPIPAAAPDLVKSLQGFLTPSNMNMASKVLGQVLTNVTKGQQTTVIISNQP